MRSLISTRRDWLGLGRLMMALAVAAGTLLVASPAAAAPPLIEPIVDTVDVIHLEGVYSQTIASAPAVSGTQMTFFDQNDQGVPIHHAKMLHAGICGSRLVMIEGAEHTLIWTHSDELLRVTDEFLGA